jgi:hypothetical protein
LADLCKAWSGRGTECEEADWRSRRVSCYPIGDKHVVEEKQLKKILGHVVRRAALLSDITISNPLLSHEGNPLNM